MVYSADSNKCAVWNNRVGYYIGLFGYYIKNYFLFNKNFWKNSEKNNRACTLRYSRLQSSSNVEIKINFTKLLNLISNMVRPSKWSHLINWSQIKLIILGFCKVLNNTSYFRERTSWANISKIIISLEYWIYVQKMKGKTPLWLL